MRTISRETIDILINLSEKILGEKGMEVVLRRTDKELSGRELVYNLASVMMEIYGQKGSFAIIRQLGRDLAKSLMEKYPENLWINILENALREFGFARRIRLEEGEACICNCVFYELLEQNNLKPIEHAVCWCGWGFIEGFMREMNKASAIEWSYRDYEKEECHFKFLR